MLNRRDVLKTAGVSIASLAAGQFASGSVPKIFEDKTAKTFNLEQVKSRVLSVLKSNERKIYPLENENNLFSGVSQRVWEKLRIFSWVNVVPMNEPLQLCDHLEFEAKTRSFRATCLMPMIREAVWQKAYLDLLVDELVFELEYEVINDLMIVSEKKTLSYSQMNIEDADWVLCPRDLYPNLRTKACLYAMPPVFSNKIILAGKYPNAKTGYFYAPYMPLIPQCVTCLHNKNEEIYRFWHRRDERYIRDNSYVSYHVS